MNYTVYLGLLVTSKLCIECSEPLIQGSNWSAGCARKHTYKCKECRAKYQREYYINNKDKCNASSQARYYKNREAVLTKQREQYINNTFGISSTEYDSYMHGASCGICASQENLVLDHCHETSKIRGVLCRKCNMAIGLLGDNPDGIKSALEYLT